MCRNPINSVLFLVLAFLSSSNIFLLLGCDFVGLIFIIVYLGAVAVLFFFIVMMINIKKMEGDSTTYLLIGLLFFFIFFFQISYYITSLYEHEILETMHYTSNKYVFLESSSIDGYNKANYFFLLGRLLYFDYFFFLVVVSILLLVGMVGAIFLTNSKTNFSSKKQFNQSSRNNKLVNIHIL